MRKGIIAAFCMLFTVVLFLGSVSASAKGKVKVKKVKVNIPYSKSAEVAKGKKIKLSPVVTVTPEKKANQKVEYRSKNKKIATVTGKGVVKGKKAGKTKIVITSKKDRRKKAVITVVVKKKPVKKVTLDKTSMSMYSGGKTALKAAISAPKGASRKLYWTSSAEKVATVSQKGIVTARGNGKAVITARAADGSNKKAVCTIQVRSFMDCCSPSIEPTAPTEPKDKVTANSNLTNMEIVNERTIKFTIDSACGLKASDVVVRSKSAEAEAYGDNLAITNIKTTDNKNFTIELFGKDKLEMGSYVQITITKLTGSVKSMEREYKEPLAYTFHKVYVGQAGEEFVQKIVLSELEQGFEAEITGLPAGLSAVKMGYYVDVRGVPTETGEFTVTIQAKDKLGNTSTITCSILIGGPEKIVAGVNDCYAKMNTSQGAEVSEKIEVKGGSGSYTFTKVPDASGLKVDAVTGRLEGYIKMEGTYTVAVDVTDNENPARTARVEAKIYVKKAYRLTVKAKDLSGESMYNEGTYVQVKSADKTTRYPTTNVWELMSQLDHSYSQNIVSGKYNVAVKYQYANITQYFYDVEVTKDMEFVVTFPLVSVRIVPSDGETDYSEVYWLDENGNTVGKGEYLHVAPGTHTLVSDTSKSSLNLTASFTVTDQPVQVAATEKE